MFVRTLDQLKSAGREAVVAHGKVRTVRMLTKADGLGFSQSDVNALESTESDLWYKHHWEANYVVAGRATVSDLTRDLTWELEPGSLYCVGPRDRHRIGTTAGVRIVSIFNPPITGTETHDDDGAYPPTGDVPPGREAMFVKTVDELRARGIEKIVANGSARTIRMLTQADGLGFTLCDVRLAGGQSNVLWYKNHWESNYILSGQGKVEDLTSGEVWPLEPGTMYVVGPDDRHSMHATTDLHLISVFNPPLAGHEEHDAKGTLPPTGPLPPGPGGA